MGRNWRTKGGRDRGFGKGSKGGGGGGGGGGSNALITCRGRSAVMGTCDAARERETSKELVNLLTQVIEEFDQQKRATDAREPKGDNDGDNEGVKAPESSSSISAMLAAELDDVRNQKNDSTQSVISVNTGVKGIVLVKIMRDDLDPLQLVRAIFERVKREKITLSRHVVRTIPFQRMFFPNEEELLENVEKVVERAFPGECNFQKREKKVDEASDNTVEASGEEANPSSGSKRAHDPSAGDDECANEEEQDTKRVKIDMPLEGVPEAAESATEAESKKLQDATPQGIFKYGITFKARNHNTLNKGHAQQAVKSSMPKRTMLWPGKPQGMFIVEALMNVGGASFVNDWDFFEDFNLRKFSAKYATDSSVFDKEIHDKASEECS